MMKQKAKAVGSTPYWWGVIEKAKRKLAKGDERAFTAAECFRSASWVTCACGKQDKALPRFGKDRQYAPVDDRLGDLGSQFAGNVESGDPFLAEKTLTRIEARVRKILSSPTLLKQQWQEAAEDI